MHAIKSVCLLALAAKICFAAPSTSLPPVSHSPYNDLQNTANGISVVVPDMLVVGLGLYGSYLFGPNQETLRNMPLPRTGRSKAWQQSAERKSGMWMHPLCDMHTEG
jgi:hypothetical protein